MYLPYILWIEIFKFLPSEDRYRAKRVSKSWYELLSKIKPRKLTSIFKLYKTFKMDKKMVDSMDVFDDTLFLVIRQMQNRSMDQYQLFFINRYTNYELTCVIWNREPRYIKIYKDKLYWVEYPYGNRSDRSTIYSGDIIRTEHNHNFDIRNIVTILERDDTIYEFDINLYGDILFLEDANLYYMNRLDSNGNYEFNSKIGSKLQNIITDNNVELKFDNDNNICLSYGIDVLRNDFSGLTERSRRFDKLDINGKYIFRRTLKWICGMAIDENNNIIMGPDVIKIYGENGLCIGTAEYLNEDCNDGTERMNPLIFYDGFFVGYTEVQGLIMFLI